MNAVFPGQPLSLREAEILRLTALGKTDSQIGAALRRSYKTIKGYQENIRVKLEGNNRAHCVLLGLDYILG